MGRGWYPTGDDAYAAIRARDVLTRHPPLLGTWSSASQWSHRLISHPGPAQFDALAVPVRLLGPGAGVAIGTALINAVCVIGIGWLALRRGGPRFVVGAMVFVGTLSWSIGSELLYDPWSQYAPLFPFMVFLFAVWAIADGDLAGLPVAVLAGTFALQTHLSYVLLVPGLLAGSLVAATVAHLAQRRKSSDSGTAAQQSRHRRCASWLGGSLALLLFAWAQPLYEQLTASPGNMSSLVRAAGTSPPNPPGISGALQAVGDVLALPPLWLPPGWAHPTFHPAIDQVGPGRPLWLVTVALVFLIALATWLGLLAVRRRDRTTTMALATAGLAVTLGFVSTARSTSPYGLEATYLRWLWPISMFTWFCIALASVRALMTSDLGRRRAGLANRRRWNRAVIPGGLVITTVIAGLTLPTVDNGTAAPRWAIPVSKNLFAAALPQLQHKGPLLLELSLNEPGYSVGPAVIAELQAHKLAFEVNGVRDATLLRQLGHSRAFDGDARLKLRVAGGEGAVHVPPGARRIAFAPGLSRRDQVALTRLTGVLAARIRRLGGVPMSARGQELETAGRLPDHLRRSIAESATNPASVLRDGVAAQLAEFHLIDTTLLGSVEFNRYLKLQDQWVNRTTALLIEAVPATTAPS